MNREYVIISILQNYYNQITVVSKAGIAEIPIRDIEIIKQ